MTEKSRLLADSRRGGIDLTSQYWQHKIFDSNSLQLFSERAEVFLGRELFQSAFEEKLPHIGTTGLLKIKSKYDLINKVCQTHEHASYE